MIKSYYLERQTATVIALKKKKLIKEAFAMSLPFLQHFSAPASQLSTTN